MVGVALTFALQQPLFSLIGWVYMILKRPYGVGDRVAIEGTKGDVVDIEFFVTTLWEINGELASSHQPWGRGGSSRYRTPSCSRRTFRITPTGISHVGNELSVQVAYETDLAYARELMVEEAPAYLGDDMRRAIERYREELAETPVGLEIRDTDRQRHPAGVVGRISTPIFGPSSPRPDRPKRAVRPHPLTDERVARSGGIPGQPESLIPGLEQAGLLQWTSAYG